MITDDTPLPFGKKWKGTPMRDIPDSTLAWFLENLHNLRPDMVEYIEGRLDGEAGGRGDDHLSDEEVAESRGMSERDLSECNQCGQKVRWVAIEGKKIPLDTVQLTVYRRGAREWKRVVAFKSHHDTCTGPPGNVDTDDGLPF